MANINNIAVSTFNTFLFVHFRWLVPLVEQCVSDKAKLHGFTDKRPAVYGLILQGHVLLQVGWRFGVSVTRWSRSTQLLYIEPG